MTEDDFNAIAWRDFIMFAWNEPAARAAFCEATGIALLPASRSPIESLIDSATKRDESTASEFVYWATTTQWGFDEAPKAWQDAHRERWEKERGS